MNKNREKLDYRKWIVGLVQCARSNSCNLNSIEQYIYVFYL